MKFRTGTTLLISAMAAAMICGAIIATGPPPTAAAASTGFTAAVNDALIKVGGIDAASERAAAFKEAVAAGIPLAEAGLTDADFTDLAAQGANVVVPCAAASAAAAEVNAVLALAGDMATEVPCGAFNPEAPVVEVEAPATMPIAQSDLSDAEQARLVAAGYESVGPCTGASGVLSAGLAAAGGAGWVCGYNETEDGTGTP